MTSCFQNFPKSEEALLDRCYCLAGMSFLALAAYLNSPLPVDPKRQKGWLGLALEKALGANAGNQAKPDFINLGIELKTIPFGKTLKPLESTFVTSIALDALQYETWETSVCLKKLKKVLWVPVEGASEIPFEARRIGEAKLWTPNDQEIQVLKQDWIELTTLMTTGYLETIDATMGEYLQVRPKAANALSLRSGFDERGTPIKTLPRGFYLRSSFTGTFWL